MPSAFLRENDFDVYLMLFRDAGSTCRILSPDRYMYLVEQCMHHDICSHTDPAGLLLRPHIPRFELSKSVVFGIPIC